MNVRGELTGTDDVRHVRDTPPRELRAVAQVEIFGDRVVLPAAGIRDALRAQHGASAVEAEEEASVVAAGLLDGELRVESHHRRACERRVLLVEIAPARLGNADLRIAHVRKHRANEVVRNHEVRVEERDVLGRRVPQPVLERAALVTLAISAVDMRDVEALRAVAIDEAARELDGVVGGIVEELDREQLARIVELGRRAKEPGEHIALVVDRELQDDARKLVVRERERMIAPATTVAAVERDEDIAIQADQRQQQKRDAIDDEDGTWKHLLDGGRVAGAERSAHGEIRTT